MSAKQEALDTVAGHCFRDQGLLRRALTHKSYAHERIDAGESGLVDNEQLEFLGDSILGFLVSELLVSHYPELAEGRLSKLKAHLVSETHLHQVARSLDLGRHLLLGRGEELSGGRAKKALLADALEALIAAVYLDAGLEAVRQFILQHVVSDVEAQLEGAGLPLADFKSALQEMAQARGLPQPRYIIVRERGPEHAKTFTVEVRVGQEWAGQAEALTKKDAGQRAAQVLLEKLTAATPC
jgi:ribonuclease-3